MTRSCDWRDLAEAGRWSAINWINLDHRDQCELLKRLKAVAKMSEIQNGIEVIACYARPDEVKDPKLRAVAEILALGELEAAVEGEPPTAPEAWADTRAEAEAFLREIRHAPEVTEGDPELSRRRHCETALEFLEQTEIKTDSAKDQMETEEERDWLLETIAEIAHFAFVAGRHFQAAQLKPFEALAARKLEMDARNRENSRKGGEARQARTKRESALLKDLALSDAELRQWIVKGEKEQVRHLRVLADRLSKNHADEGLFQSTRGCRYSKGWFEDFLSELRLSGRLEEKISSRTRS